MRLRERRRIEKRARIAAHQWPQFAGAGPEELLAIAAQPEHGWYIRGEAIRLLGSKKTPGFLLEEFYAGQTELEIWEAALTMEHAGRPDVIAPMIGALHDSNHHRRQAAARVLGWNGRSRATSAKALLSVLKDQAQPQAVRSETCVSLAYLNWRPSVPALVAATKEDDPRIRFWAAFGLGGMRNRITGDISPQVIGPLEALLDDGGVAPGWWSVGKEALSMLSNSIPKYREVETREKERINNDPNSSAEDRRWAQ